MVILLRFLRFQKPFLRGQTHDPEDTTGRGWKGAGKGKERGEEAQRAAKPGPGKRGLEGDRSGELPCTKPQCVRDSGKESRDY